MGRAEIERARLLRGTGLISAPGQAAVGSHGACVRGASSRALGRVDLALVDARAVWTVGPLTAGARIVAGHARDAAGHQPERKEIACVRGGAHVRASSMINASIMIAKKFESCTAATLLAWTDDPTGDSRPIAMLCELTRAVGPL